MTDLHDVRASSVRPCAAALGLLAAVALATCAPSGPVEPALTVAMAPGRIDDFNRIIAPGFEQQTGVSLNPIGLRSADQVARVRIERAHPTIDVLWIDLAEAQLLAGEGLLAQLSEQDVPHIAEVRDAARSPLGIAPIAFSSALGFLYNTQLANPPPRSWAELWDPRFEGQLALFDFGSTIGPLTLVMAARLEGGDERNVEPGFAKLAGLKRNAAGFRTGGPENNNLVAQGEAAVTFGLANQARDLAANGAPVAWRVPEEGALALPQGFQVVAGTQHAEQARRLVDHVLSREVQTQLANDLLLVVTNRTVTVAPDVAPLVPVDHILYFDLSIIGASRGAWTNRFNREILGG
jgi:putative spermidine/putrescine transport system substrate-binding protein